MNENDEIINEILNITNSQSEKIYTNLCELHNKSATLMAFHGAIIVFAIDYSSLEKISNLLNLNKLEIILNIFKYIISLGILGLSLASIILFIIILKSISKSKLNINTLNENMYTQETINFKKRLIESSKEILKDNSLLLTKKHKLFNAGLILTIIEMILIIFNIVLNII